MRPKERNKAPKTLSSTPAIRCASFLGFSCLQLYVKRNETTLQILRLLLSRFGPTGVPTTPAAVCPTAHSLLHPTRITTDDDDDEPGRESSICYAYYARGVHGSVPAGARLGELHDDGGLVELFVFVVLCGGVHVIDQLTVVCGGIRFG